MIFRTPQRSKRRRHHRSHNRLLRMEQLEDRAVPAGLVAAYSFDEGTGATVGDSSGNQNVGTISNAVWSNPGRFGKALSFNGTNSWVTVNDSNSLDLTTAMTLEAWIRPTFIDHWETVIMKERPAGLSYVLYGGSPSGQPASFITPAGTDDIIGAGDTQLTPLFAWTHVAATYDGALVRLYVNGNLVSSQSCTASITTSSGVLRIGGNSFWGEYFAGLIDEVRIYDRVLSESEVETDMITPLGTASGDVEPPTVAVQTPGSGGTASHVVTLSATAADNIGIANVEFFVDGNYVGVDSATPFQASWNSTSAANGTHVATAIARDVNGNQTTSAPVNFNVLNPGFADEVVVPGISDATTIAFLPDGRMLVGELTNKVLVVQPGANRADPQPVLDLGYTYQVGEQGLMDIAIDPAFSQNGYIYIYYTKGFPGSQNRNRLSRFTLSGNAVVPGSEFVLWDDDRVENPFHHAGAIAFGNDGKIYFTTGDEDVAMASQQLNNYWGKVLRINPDGSIPLDNPFYDGAGPNKDEIWAYGLRNPYRMSIDPATGRMYIGEVGGNDSSKAIEELNIGAAGANYGWPLEEGDGGLPGMTSPIFSYPHNFRDAAITGGFVYHGSQFPAEYAGSYFFGDYAQNRIRRMTFDPQGNITQVLDFFAADGSVDQLVPGDIVKMVEGPDGCLYYVDIGFDGAGGANPAAIRRIRYVAGNQPPVVVAAANPTTGAAPLQVSFSSAGSLDPEGLPLSYLWNFGDGTTSTAANPTHLYTAFGPYAATLRVSDGVSFTLSDTLKIIVGTPPMPTILGPADGSFFRAGDAIAFSATATDLEDVTLPASAYSWEIRFRHEGHIHPAGVFSNTQSGVLNIPATGHDFEGNTRYEIVLFVTDSTGLTASTSVTIYPEKVDLSFDSVPSGLTVQVDGISRQTPFVVDSLVGFRYTIAAQDQVSGGSAYTFMGWSDGSAPSHELIVPSSDQNYVATFAAVQVVLPGDYNSDQKVDGADYALWRKLSGSNAILHNDTTPGSVTAADYNVWKTHFGETAPPVTLPGDYNSNQTVNAADYVLWRKLLGSTAILPNDTTPTSITAADYNVWKAHYGETTGQGQVVLLADYNAGEVADAALLGSAVFLPKDTSPARVTPEVEMPIRTRRPTIHWNESRNGVPSQSTTELLLLASLTTSPANLHRETTARATTIDTNEESQDAADVSLAKTLDSIFAQFGKTWTPRPVHKPLTRL